MQTTKKNLQKTVRAHPDRIESSRKWLIVDAEGKTLGRLAVDIAKRLQGKHKAYYCDQWDCGDYIIVLNADKVVTTGNKLTQKIYYKHTGWKGHLREVPLHRVLEKHPERVLTHAVKGMLPKNKHRKARLKRMKLFMGSDHPYEQYAPQDLYATQTAPKAAPQQQQ